MTRFSAATVFMDVDGISPGRDFRKAIQENLAQCSVFLALIGPQWLQDADPNVPRRIDDPADYLRIEVAGALERDIAVITVLVRGAKMPNADDLPGELRDLAFRNAVELTHARWKSDVELLAGALRPLLETAPPANSVAPPAASSPTETPAAKMHVDPALLTRLTTELARYIGPIAGVVIKRNLSRYSTLPELCEAVAKEIDSAQDRKKFLAACR